MNVSLNNYDLTHSEQILSIVIGIPYALRHLELAQEPDCPNKLAHRVMAILEFIPIIGAIAALFDRIFGSRAHSEIEIELLNFEGRDEDEQIENFITRFLHPYITGQITENNEPEDRKPLIEILLENLNIDNQTDRERVEEKVLNIYLQKAALGLYVNRLEKLPLQKEEPEFEHLINALEKALPKDFPQLQLSKEELIARAGQALDEVNKTKGEKSYTGPIFTGQREAKLQLLNANSKLFF